MSSKTTQHLFAKNPLDLNKTVEILARGEIVALPTETVYGLAAIATNPQAIHKIYKAKKRPKNNPLIIHIAQQDWAYDIFDCANFDSCTLARFEKLSKEFWPGPITLVAPKSPKIPDIVCSGLTHVALRLPSHPVCKYILQNLGQPLVMPSANISTRPSPTCAQHVLHTLGGRIDAVLDGGICQFGIESTVLQINTPKPKILRLGSTSQINIEKCLGEKIDLAYKPTAKPLAPGQNYKHYSPKISRLKLVNFLSAHKYWHKLNNIMCTSNYARMLTQKLGPRSDNTNLFIMPDQPNLYAKKLYHKLYEAEKFPNLELIIITPQTTTSAWQPVIDRLTRACEN